MACQRQCLFKKSLVTFSIAILLKYIYLCNACLFFPSLLLLKYWFPYYSVELCFSKDILKTKESLFLNILVIHTKEIHIKDPFQLLMIIKKHISHLFTLYASGILMKKFENGSAGKSPSSQSMSTPPLDVKEGRHWCDHSAQYCIFPLHCYRPPPCHVALLKHAWLGKPSAVLQRPR